MGQAGSQQDEECLQVLHSSREGQLLQRAVDHTLTISGCAVMICSAGASFSLPLYFKSPMALDKLRLPFTLQTQHVL